MTAIRSTLLSLTAIALISGCATPSSVQVASDYEVCRLSLLRPPMQSTQAITEADRQVGLRGLNCAVFAARIYSQQQAGLLMLQQSANQFNSNQVQRTGSSGSASGMRCFKVDEWTSGTLKNCVYNCMGSLATTTIPITQLCPLNIVR